MKKSKKVFMGVLGAVFVISSIFWYKAYATGTKSLNLVPSDKQVAQEDNVDETEVITDIPFVEEYERIQGKVLSITLIENDGSVVALDEEGNEVENASMNQYFVLLETEDSGTINFVITNKTVFPKESEIVEGAIVTGFYNINLPVPMIYPPQYHADVMVVGAEESESVFVGRFDENLISSDNQLKLNISSETEIVYEDGLTFNEGIAVEDEVTALANMKLIVLYTVSTRSIPAQTTPHKIIVPYSNVIMPLNELSDGGFETLLPTIFDSDINMLSLDINTYPIIVEDKVLAYASAYIKDNIVMIPLRDVSEALGFDVSWDASTKNISVGSLATLTIGEDNHQLGIAPEIIKGKTYIPISFFRNVMLINNAYVFEGQIVINNQELMN